MLDLLSEPFFFFEHVLCSAGRRTPDASIGIEITGKVPDAVAHG
jgi:hypothetical protein